MNNLNRTWHAGHLGEGDFREEVVFDSNSGLVCNVIDKGECGQSKANLIAAAPELLDAVIAAHAYLCDKDPRADRRLEIKTLLESLIAKATKEQV